MFPQAFCNPKSHCNPSAIQDTRNCIPKVLEQERMGSVQSGTHSDNQARWYDCMRKPEQIVMDQGRGWQENSLTQEAIIIVIRHSVIGHNKSVNSDAVIHRHNIFCQIKVESWLSDDYFLFYYYRVPLSGIPDCSWIADGFWDCERVVASLWLISKVD